MLLTLIFALLFCTLRMFSFVFIHQNLMQPTNTNDSVNKEELPQKASETAEQKTKREAKEIEQKRMQQQQYQKNLQLQQKHLAAIHEQMSLQALISHPLDIAFMLDQFVNNEGFYIKVQALHQHYSSYRKTRRDGSCFYRALAFSIFENIYVKHDVALQTRLREKLHNSKIFLIKAGFQLVVFEDILNLFVEKLDDYKINTLDDVVNVFCDPDVSNYLILMLRFIASSEMKNNPVIYETFIENQIPIEFHCQTEVEPMDKEADQICIMALLNYLQVGIRIVYLDSNVKSKEAYTVVLPESMKETDVKATMLYRPGHYDILYK